MDYRIGLDIGIASVGWAVLKDDSHDQPCRIEDLGVRIFDRAEVPKTGASLAAPRREARTARRRLRRRRYRLDRIKYMLEQNAILSAEEIEQYYQQKNLPDIYELRCKALDELITKEELAQILLHIAKHRGFKSTRKSELNTEESGKVLEAIKQNQKIRKDNNYRTVGEMIFKDDSFRMKAPWHPEGTILVPRNHADDYQHTILRDELTEEVKVIFACQRKYGSLYASEKIEEDYLRIMLGQRSFDKGPGNQADGTKSPYGGNMIERMVGKCTFEPEEFRAAKAAYSAERFILFQKVNNLTIVKRDKESIHLNSEERSKIIHLAYQQKEVKFSAIRKVLNLALDETFKEINYGLVQKDNWEETVKAVETKTRFISLQWTHQWKEILGITNIERPELKEIELLDTIATILTLYKSDDNRMEKLQEAGLECCGAEQLLPLNPSKFLHLSFKAIHNIMPHLEEGFIYNEACDKAGYDFKGDSNCQKSMYLKGESVQNILNSIPNPVVKRSISQTVKVINAIIRKYGSPQSVHVELAREMSKNFKERKEIENQNKKNSDRNEAVKKQIQEYGVLQPGGLDIVKFKLWQEQDGICLYSGKTISIDELFKNDLVEIDHIVPYSISFDDSYHNKVLVKSECNREKGNKLPYEYFKGKEHCWEKYEMLVNQHVKDFKKKKYLLKTEFTEEERKAFKERNLTDTKYITTVVYNLIRRHLEFAPFNDTGKEKRVAAVNGAVTDYLKKRWGLPKKDRRTDKHHAMDAVVVACCTEGMINKISRNIQGRELKYSRGFRYVDELTGEILEPANFTRNQWDEMFGVQVPKPWSFFREELEMRMSENPDYFLNELHKKGYHEPDNLKPIFVSRMPNHKVTGAIHADTIRSPRHLETDGIVLYKTALANLKLDKEGEIENYYNPQSDRLLYEALKKRLQEFDGNAKEAFTEPFYKPKSDGCQGPLVSKVKLYQKQTMGVYVNHKKGVADNANGSMIRVDIFKEKNKYYYVPIYISDTIKEELPNKASMGKRTYAEWPEMKEENFIFSLYPRDLFEYKFKKEKYIENVYGETVDITCNKVYFVNADISVASFRNAIAHDNSFVIKAMGIQNMQYIKKYQVDILGNCYEVKNEKRLRFH